MMHSHFINVDCSLKRIQPQPWKLSLEEQIPSPKCSIQQAKVNGLGWVVRHELTASFYFHLRMQWSQNQ